MIRETVPTTKEDLGSPNLRRASCLDGRFSKGDTDSPLGIYRTREASAGSQLCRPSLACGDTAIEQVRRSRNRLIRPLAPPGSLMPFLVNTTGISPASRAPNAP